MHPRFQYDLDNCAIRSAIQAVGETWSLLILREAIYGLRRFDDFARALDCGRGVLSDRLKKLMAAGILERRTYAEPGQRARAEYHLTDKGWDVVPALLALGQWSARWTPPPGGLTAQVTLRRNGQPVSVVMSADAKAKTIAMDEVRIALGPGAQRIV